MQCPHCQFDNRQENRFCEECGAILYSTCPACRTPISPTAKFCGACGTSLPTGFAEADRGLDSDSKSDSTPSTPEAERRQLTVMFCDLVGSTELSQKLDPEDLRDLMHAYRDACSSTLRRHDGFVARYTGDGVLAYFGYPRAHEDDPERAVRAGLEVVRAVQQLNPQIADHDELELAVRVGIATGPTVVGDLIGKGASQESVVVGEVPNLASRLQMLAKPNEVVTAPSTRELSGQGFRFEDLGLQTLRGISQPLRAWRVLGEVQVESRFEATLAAGT